LMETGFFVLVIPGLDPGITPAAGVRWDPRIKSGDDDEKACAPAKFALRRTTYPKPGEPSAIIR
jgi:hypothetical protein